MLQVFPHHPGYSIQWNFSYLDFFYSGTSVVQTTQINYVVCSLSAVMKFWLNKAQVESLKVIVYLFGGSFIFLLIATTGC